MSNNPSDKYSFQSFLARAAEMRARDTLNNNYGKSDAEGKGIEEPQAKTGSEDADAAGCVAARFG